MLTAAGRLEAEDRSLATLGDDLLRRDLARARQRCLQRAECEADIDTASPADGDPYTCLDKSLHIYFISAKVATNLFVGVTKALSYYRCYEDAKTESCVKWRIRRGIVQQLR